MGGAIGKQVLVGLVGAALAPYTGGASLTWAAAFAGIATSVVLGQLSMALTPSMKRQSLSSTALSSTNNIEQRGITRQVRQPISTRKILYGEVRTSGSIIKFEATNNNQYLHMVIILAGHEVEDIGEIWLDDYPITADMLDGSNIVNTGRYNGKVRIIKETGNQTVANATLVADTSAISTDVGNETAYIYLRFDFDRDKFPHGIPNVSAWVKGKKTYDPRTSTTQYSPSIPLMARDHLTDGKYGYGATSAEIDDTFTNSAANKAEELVTVTNKDFTASAVDPATNLISIADSILDFQTADQVVLLGTPPTGLSTLTNYYIIPYQRKKSDDTAVRFQLATTIDNAITGVAINFTGSVSGFTIRKNAEPRYFGGGILDSGTDPKANLEDIISGMAGRMINSGGVWKIRAGSYVSPTISLNENHIVGGMAIQTKVPRRERFNTVKGTYISQINNGQPTDYPSITNSTYITQDHGETILKDMPLPFTQRPHVAQRIAKIELEKMRQEIVFSASFKLHAMQLIAGDTVNITNAQMGWTNKIFEVTSWELAIDKGGDSPRPIVNLELRETATTVYDWVNGEETRTDPAPDTNLPDAFTVPAPTGLAVTPIEVPTAAGDFTYRFKLSWTAPSNIFVTNGGHYEVEFKQSGSLDWNRSFRAEDSDTFIFVNQVKPSIPYDARIRSVNNLGVRSSYNSLFGFSVDSPSGSSIQIDYRFITESVTDYSDYGNITNAVAGILDFGSIV